MLDSYKSQLISRLYNTNSFKEIKEVLEIIEEMNDSDFIFPIYDAYKRNKNESFSHYFISALDNFKHSEVDKILIELVEDEQIKEADLVYSLPLLVDRKIFFQRITKKVIAIFLKNIKLIINNKNTEEVDEFELSDMLNYLSEAKELDNIKDILKDIFVDDNFDRSFRENILEKLLQLNAAENLQYFIDNYNLIQQKESEVILAKKLISKWSGPKTTRLLEIIKEQGSERVKKIITTYEEEKNNKVKKQQQLLKEQDKKKEEEFNGKLVDELIDVIRKINELSKTSLHYSNNLFTSIEEIALQLKIANDQDSLVRDCLQLRGFLDKISDDTEKHGIQIEQIKTLMPPSIKQNEYEMPLNRMYLSLYSKNIKVDFEIFGLRKLRKLFNKFAAHESEQDYINILKELELYQIYLNGEWEKLHISILKLLKQNLEKMRDQIIKLEKEK